MNKLWRSGLLAFLLLIVAGFVLYSSYTSAPQGTQAAPTAQTRSVTDAAGRTIAVPLHPQRVLALGEFDLDALLALGIEPVGATNGRGQATVPNYLLSRVTHVASVGGFAQPNMDQVIAAQPDLIVTSAIRDEQVLAQLQKVAPTLVTISAGVDWQTGFKQMAALLAQEDKAMAFLAQYQQRVAALRAQIKPAQTVSIVRWDPKGPGFMFKDAFASLVVQDLGLQRPVSQQKGGANHSPPLSLEALSEIDADWIFIGTLAPEGEAATTLKTVQNSPPFQQLNAVKQQRVRVIDGSLWTIVGGPLAAMAVLDDIEKNLR